ncbi:hypothetical protein HBB16_18435 [Pseudonocardia sp. MCCB 268]|nr:hypothetical protein [Pseudonocardia cytotoxica]
MRTPPSCRVRIGCRRAPEHARRTGPGLIVLDLTGVISEGSPDRRLPAGRPAGRDRLAGRGPVRESSTPVGRRGRWRPAGSYRAEERASLWPCSTRSARHGWGVRRMPPGPPGAAHRCSATASASATTRTLEASKLTPAGRACWPCWPA